MMRRMTPLHRQSVAQNSADLGIRGVTLYNWKKAWRLQGDMVLASEKAQSTGLHRQVQGGARDCWA